MTADPGMRAARRMIAFHTLASFGLGLVFPFTAIYLTGQSGFGTGGAALYYAGAGGANLAVAVLLAARPTRLSDHALAALGTGLSIAGYLMLSQARSVPMVVIAAVCNGAGQGCFLAAVVPIVNTLVPRSRRREVFSRRYQALNVSLALGAVVGGLIASVVGRETLPWLFVAQAAMYLPLTAMLVRGARGSARQEPDAIGPVSDGRPNPGGVPLRSLIGMVAAVALFQLGAYMFGYSQFEATAPLVADRLLGTGLFVVSMMLAVNVAVISIAQGRMTKALTRRPETFGLRVAVLLWLAGFVVAAITSAGARPWQITGLMGYAVLFGLGECAYSCSFHPWLISAVPERELTRASALVNSMMGVGLFVGPSLGVALVGVGRAPLVWVVLAGCCGVVLLTVRDRRPALAFAVGQGRADARSREGVVG